MSVEIICGDARTVLETLPAQSVHACVTSPPYWHQRDYGCSAQIGLESAPADYIAVLVGVFSAVHRVLRDDGTCWIVIGDSYAGSWGNQGRRDERGTQRPINGAMLQQCDDRYPAHEHNTGAVPAGFKPKDLMMLPHRLAIALQDAGWYVRQELIWSKPAPMPESVRDRCTRSHEFIFMLAKQPTYFYDADAIREPATMLPQRRLTQRHSARDAAMRPDRKFLYALRDQPAGESHPHGRNKRSVWSVNTQPLGEEHYAAFPEKLVEPMILAGTSEAGCCAHCGEPWRRVVERTGHVNGREPAHVPGNTPTKTDSTGWAPTTAATEQWQAGCSCAAGSPVPCTVLDPFAGSGTVGLVSRKLGRNAVLIDLNPGYCDLAQRRVDSVPYPLFSAAGSSEGAAR